MTSGKTNKISLAAKWCPSLDSSFDKSTLLCESIARKIFPREAFPDVVEEGHYAYRVRDRLRKQVLVPLRKTLQLPEVYMGAKDWSSLPYNRVASVAMKSYKEIFLNHDAERFQKYLEDARQGKTKIAAGAVLPHEIIKSFVRRMKWGMNTDFQKVFDLILRVAVEGRLKAEDMVKRVFVFSDMEFDQAASSSSASCFSTRQTRTREMNTWETDYEEIVRKYREAGYGEVVPEIVFWNLRDSSSTPVHGSKKGVALVSGFSKNLIKMFLDNDGEINPMAIMGAAISGTEYSKLVVID